MKLPLVSVAMITYNHAPHIGRAIEGVMEQKTSFAFELVIGEDCSTDETREAVFQYHRRYPQSVRVITSKSNVGMKRNWLRTLGACQGEYVAFCEGDDCWHHPQKLQRQVEYLECHTDCGMVYSDFDWFDTKCRRVMKSYFSRLGSKRVPCPEIDDILTGRAGILSCTVVARRRLVCEIIEADPYLHQSESFKMTDTQLWAEMSLIARVHGIDEPLALHNILLESATQSKDRSKVLRFSISNAEMCLYLCDKHRLPRHIRRLHEEIWVRESLELAFREGRRDLAESVKKTHGKLSMKNRILYWGARNRQVAAFIVLGQKIMRTINRAAREWTDLVSKLSHSIVCGTRSPGQT